MRAVRAKLGFMSVTRKKFVLRFLAAGYVFHFATKLLLNQAPDALFATPNQAAWQQLLSTVLAPIRLVLVGPVSWLLQDPDPPPPFRMMLFAAYWSLLALGLHAALSRRRSARHGVPSAR